ncbi:hypothetical protein JTB14_010105 [Gonioctena quinquepunctata]|nr:hypothetical protein JTB14_010105 [Gonioctena quinquepunctata]
MLRKSGKVSEESNFPATQFLETNHINNEVLLNNEDEDPFECIDDSSTNNIELKTETLETEDNVSYEDVKPEIWVKESGENATYPNYVADILIGPNFSHERSIDSETWPQQNIGGWNS